MQELRGIRVADVSICKSKATVFDRKTVAFCAILRGREEGLGNENRFSLLYLTDLRSGDCPLLWKMVDKFRICAKLEEY